MPTPVIRANCRDRLTAADIDFITTVLADTPENARGLQLLLLEAETRDKILEHPRLFQAMLNAPGIANVSPQLYFYVLVRRELPAFGIKDRATADYVAELLAEFETLDRVQHPLPDCLCAMDRLVELLTALPRHNACHQFNLHAHIGNLALWLAGIFYKRIAHNTDRRAAPNIAYFEELGRANFSAAGRHRLAEECHLQEIFLELAEAFHNVRLALNDLTDRLTSLNDPPMHIPDMR